MSDIVERLVKHAAIESNELEDDLYAAADEIERLRAALRRVEILPEGSTAAQAARLIARAALAEGEKL